ncbi:acyl-CoA desaturase [Rhodobacterales bacterium HKCCE2091]|nr:acyl-CoA desaturase [Rhodobacterales bacterium HKCCE2091]
MTGTLLAETERVIPRADTSATEGRIAWDAVKSLWLFAMMAGGIAALVLTPSWSGAAVFVALTAVTICAGHSVGMHRLLIHRSFTAPIWVEHILVWLGTLVGMAGPFGMIRAHDMRDWHQRQTDCPPHPSHGAGFWRDAWWQLHCRYDLDRPPDFVIEPRVARDRFYRFVERTWMAQQLAVAVPLFLVGGIGWVLSGVCLRVSISLIGHWMVGHFAHKRGQQGWRIAGLPVQGYNLRGLGLLTFGENWHGNHHAFPHSAKLGIEPGQLDPGYWLILVMEQLGLARDVQRPASQPPREGLTRAFPSGESPV